MEKTILAGSNAVLSDIKVNIVDWAVNVTELSMDNHLYRKFIFLREFGKNNPVSYDVMSGTKDLSHIIEKYKTQALLYATSYWGNMIIHIDQVKHLTKTITIESPFMGKYDVNLQVIKDYNGCIRYRLDYKDKCYTSIFTDFRLGSVVAKEYYLCKDFGYHLEPLPNAPIVLIERINTMKENDKLKELYDWIEYQSNNKPHMLNNIKILEKIRLLMFEAEEESAKDKRIQYLEEKLKNALDQEMTNLN